MATGTASSDGPFRVLLRWTEPLQAASIVTSVSSLHNRVPTSIDDELLEQQWHARVAAIVASGEDPSKKLFNATKFRVHKALWSDAEKRLCLQLGITDYKTSSGCVANVGRFLALGNGSEIHLSQALGVEALVVTRDSRAVLFKRSEHVADQAGWYCCPGGHAEPSNILAGTASVALSLDEQANWFSLCSPRIIVAEIFDSVVDEVVAELGLPRDTLVNEGLVAIVQHAQTRKPDFIFRIRCTLTAAEVSAIHHRREAAEAYESVAGSLLIVPCNAKEIEDCLLEFQVTPPSAACLTLACFSSEPAARSVVNSGADTAAT